MTGDAYAGEGVTQADFAALRERLAAEEAADGATIGEPGRPGGRIVCHGCGARVFRYATAASGRNYCPTCTKRIAP